MGNKEQRMRRDDMQHWTQDTERNKIENKTVK